MAGRLFRSSGIAAQCRCASRPQSSSSASDGRVAVIGHRHGHRSRSLMGTFGRIEIEVPRARLNGPGGKTTECNSQVLRAYQRRTLAADALIASTYLAGTKDRKSTRLNSSHSQISYAVFCLKKKT